MFKKKEDSKTPLYQEDYVACEVCKHLVSKSEAQKVLEKNWGYGWLGPWNSNLWYCPEHRKPYSRIESICRNKSYYAEIQVSEDGTPLGYVKAPEEKLKK